MHTFWRSKEQPSYAPLDGSSADGHDLESEPADDELHNRPGKSSRYRSSLSPYLIHGALILTYTVIFFVAIQSRTRCTDREFTRATLSADQYEPHVFDGFRLQEIDRYFGTPDESIEENWKELLEYESVRVPKEYLEPGQLENAVELPGGEYFASLWMHHDLRCLKSLHRLLYRDHFSPNMTDADRRMFELHTSHCLDALRQTIQCKGDMSLLVMQWTEKEKLPTVNPASYSNHKCAKWDGLRAWGKERAFNPRAPGVLVHPTLGPAYSDGTGMGLTLLPEEEAAARGY
ncbi:hypothetical protein GQ53DRAFT_844127 [Thozetella sp. PMI_491]|nr:hypothetical protein GQ53DRAFT_844127 [Thozetella sp. PMI_491]